MDHRRFAALAPRQVQCLRLVGQLKASKEIAQELGIAVGTVNTHIDRAVATLGFRDRREAARFVCTFEKSSEKSTTDEIRLPPTPPDQSDDPPNCDGQQADAEQTVACENDTPTELPTQNQPLPYWGENGFGDLTIKHRLIIIAGLTIGILMGFAAFVAALEGVYRLGVNFAPR